jgi:DtxR family transcriptional regulator, Mn-dependent transcriptional regulator
MELSSSMQDYLEKILELEEDQPGIRITDIAKKLNIAKASVHQTVRKLKKLGFVHHETYGPVSLTEKGRCLAEKISRRHIRLRQFLVEVLKVSPHVAEEDACRMEHAVSSETMDKLTDFLCSNGYLKDGCDIKDA